jgi:hypothetical protein
MVQAMANERLPACEHKALQCVSPFVDSRSAQLTPVMPLDPTEGRPSALIALSESAKDPGEVALVGGRIISAVPCPASAVLLHSLL